MLYITSPPSIVPPIRAEQKNVDKWFIHQKRTGSADLKNSRKTGSNPSKCFCWISLSLTHTQTTFTFPVKARRPGTQFISAVVGTIMEEVEDTKIYFALLLGPYLLLLVGPRHQAPWYLTIPPAYSFPTSCGVITHLLRPREMKITLSAMTNDPSAGAAEMSVPQAWAQWIWASYFLITSILGWPSLLTALSLHLYPCLYLCWLALIKDSPNRTNLFSLRKDLNWSRKF